jgi:hypothetical protein
MEIVKPSVVWFTVSPELSHQLTRDNSGLTVNQTTDGLTISIDLTKCGLDYKSFQQQWDWFIEANDTSLDGKVGVLESLSLTTLGRTNALLGDTDDDGVLDGTEIDAMQDPLSTDSDRDGIPQSLDADDSTVAWLPAAAISIDDHHDNTYALNVYLPDEMPLITSATFTLQSTTGSSSAASATRSAGGWAIRLTSTNMPSTVLMRWRDSMDGNGSLRIGLASTGNTYRLQSLEMNYTSEGSGASSGWQIANLGTQIALNVIVGAKRVYDVGMIGKTAYEVARGVSSGDGWLVPLPVKLVLFFSPWEDSDTMRVRGPVQTLVVARQGDVQVFAGPGSLIVPREFLARFQAQGIQSADLGSSGTFVGIPDPSGALRTLHPVGDGLVVLTSMGHVVTDAWKWTNPTAQQSDWHDTVPQPWLVNSEANLADTVLPSASANEKLGARHCATVCRYGGSEVAHVTITDAGDGLTTQFEEKTVDVPMRFLKSQWVSYNLNQFAPSFNFDARITDAINGQVALWQTQTLAKVDGLHSAQGGYWFWDGGSTEVNCADSNANRNVPRCVKFTVDSSIDEHTFMNHWTGEEFQTLKLKWKTFSGTGTSRTDAASVTGRIGSHEGFFLPVGEDTSTAFIQAMDTTMNGEDLSSYGAHVLAAYDWQIGQEPTAGVYYRET